MNEPIAAPGPAGTVDGVHGEGGAWIAVAPADATVIVRGWALDAGARPFARIECSIGGAQAQAVEDDERPDVAAVHSSPANVGFRAIVPLAAAGIGPLPVAVTGVRDDGTRTPVPVRAMLDVVPALAQLPALPAGTAHGSIDDAGAEALASRRADRGGMHAVPMEGALVVRGWAASPAGQPPDAAYVEIEGGRVTRGMTGYPRPDVGVRFGTDGRGFGFRVRVPATLMGPGLHTVRVLVAAGGALCPVGDPVAVVVVRAPDALPSRSAAHGRADAIGRVDAERRVLDERADVRVAAGERLVVTGWAGDPARATLPDLVLLAVDDALHGTVRRGLVRDDVAAATACEAMRASGFSVVIAADRLSPGPHQADLIAVYGDDVVLFDAFAFDVVSGAGTASHS